MKDQLVKAGYALGGIAMQFAGGKPNNERALQL